MFRPESPHKSSLLYGYIYSSPELVERTAMIYTCTHDYKIMNLTYEFINRLILSCSSRFLGMATWPDPAQNAP